MASVTGAPTFFEALGFVIAAIILHMCVNWIFQKESGRAKFDWKSTSNFMMECLSPPIWLYGLILVAVLFFFPPTSPYSLEFRDDIAKRLGYTMGSFFGVVVLSYVISVILKIIFMILRSSFVRKIFGG